MAFKIPKEEYINRTFRLRKVLYPDQRYHQCGT